MKLSPLLLAGSLVANAVLAFALWGPHPLFSAGTPRHSANPAASDAAASGANPAATAAPGKASAPAAPGEWTAVNHGDLKDLVARLRAAGWPPSVIRAIVMAEVHRQLVARYFGDLPKEQPPGEYWSTKWNQGPDPKFAAAQQRLWQEQTSTVEDLLGDSVDEEDPVATFWRRHQFGDLPLEKVQQVQHIGTDYNDLRTEIFRSASGGPLTAEDQAKLSYLDQQMRTDLLKVLTPAQLDDYLMRSSMPASMLRSQLSSFEPTEDEFRALFRAGESADSTLGLGSSVSNQQQMEQRKAAMDAVAKATFSPERFAEYQQATDPRYTMLNNIVHRYELPRTAVAQVASLQESFQQQAGAIRGNAKLSADDRATQLGALAEEAAGKIGGILGDSAFETYKQYSGFNYWFKPPAQTAPVTPAPPKG
ncbi:MAG TPA: hypothetical protein VHE13_08280 [Opitutus sp.]|nr:hypothetical protein [Opitutus sp.]